MASTHKSLRSGTANKRPTTSIADGQIALNTNTTSPGLFFKDSTGATIIKVGPVHVGTTAPNASPAAGGSSGNSTGEVWLDTSLTPNGVKIWNGASWTNATPIGSTTVQGLLELATNAETQTGTDPDRAVTPAGLQSKVSDSTSTTSSTTIASSTAVKSAYDLANAALPKSGGTVTGNLEIGTTGSLSFEGATADAFETTIAVVDPTADRTITLPDTTGTVVTTGDTGTVTSTMIADGTIVDADISATAEIAVSKLADGTARQLLQTDAAGTGVEWASNIDIPGTLDVTSTATFDSIASYPLGSAAAPTLTFTGDTNTGIYSPGADQVAISTGGSGRLFVDASGNVGIGGAPVANFEVTSPQPSFRLSDTNGTVDNNKYQIYINSSQDLQFQAFSDAGVGGGSVWKFTRNASQIENFIGTRSGVDRIALSNWDNKITFSNALGVLGTATAHDLQITTNNTERLRITSAGLVGIGTSSPSTTLSVAGGISGTAGANISGAGWGVLPYVANSLVIDNNAGEARFFATGANATTRGSFIFYNGETDGGAGAAMVIDSSSRVGIGTASAGHKLDLLVGGGADGVNVYNNATGAAYYQLATTSRSYKIEATGSDLRFYDNTGSAERARIDSSGRWLLGTSSAGGNELIQVQGVSTSSTAPGGIALRRSSIGNTDDIGFISFTNASGNVHAQIRAFADGTPGAGDYPGALVFSTTADGASSPTERMRISNQGTTTVLPAANLNAIVARARDGASSGGPFLYLGYNSATDITNGTYCYSVATNGNVLNTNGSYTAISDAKLKENIIDASTQWDDLKSIKIRHWNFKEETGHETHRQIGPIAQELETVCPGLVFETPDRDEDGNETGEVTKGVNQSVLYMKAVKALQEAMERIEQLEAEMAEVKAQLS